MMSKTINEYRNEVIKRFNTVVKEIVDDDIADKIIIPKGATNGDMIKALFPNAEIHTGENYCDERDVVFNLSDEFMCVSMDWWNAPYKKEEHKDETN